MGDPKRFVRPSTTEVIEVDLRGLADSAVTPPPPELDRYLDAAAACFARFGLFRTTVQDVARELKVNRTTVYRQIGNIDQMAQLLAAREMWRLLSSIHWSPDADSGPEIVVQAMEHVVTAAVEHPVLAKVLADEPHAANVRLLAGLPDLLRWITSVLSPPLRQAMDGGVLASLDPDETAEWLVRVALSLVLVPPLTDLRSLLTTLIVPALTPPTSAADQAGD